MVPLSGLMVPFNGVDLMVPLDGLMVPLNGDGLAAQPGTGLTLGTARVLLSCKVRAKRTPVCTGSVSRRW